MLYRLRSDHPLSSVLSTLFEAEERRFQSILDGARSAAESGGPGLIAFWMFGSVARGEDFVGSDLDFVLVAEADALPRLADAVRDGLAAPAVRLGFTLALVTLGTDDVLRLAAKRDPWWTGVTRDVVPLIGGHPEYLMAALRRAVGKATVA